MIWLRKAPEESKQKKQRSNSLIRKKLSRAINRRIPASRDTVEQRWGAGKGLRCRQQGPGDGKVEVTPGYPHG